MAEEKINDKGKDKGEEREGDRIIDLAKRVDLIATKDAPYHKEGEKIKVSPVVAEIMLKNKWAKKVSE